MRAILRIAAVMCLAALACAAQTTTTPTFSKEVVRIFQAQCQSCHHPGDIAPFSMMDYKSVRPWARSIQEQVALGKMPPWKPALGIGDFLGARILSAQDKDTINRWVDGGAPEGNPADLPTPLTFPDGWALGQPDLVLSMDQAYAVSATGADVYRCFSLPTNLAADTYVSAVQIRPGDRTVVHHVILFNDPTGKSVPLDAADPAPGYTCFGDPGFDPDVNFFAAWAPGLRPSYLMPGTAMQLAKGGRIVMQVHYHPQGLDTMDTTQMGIYFTRGPVDKLVRVLPLVNTNFTIPAGETHYKVSASSPTIPFAAHLVNIGPHMHLLGREEQVRLVAGGKTTPLIDIPDWDFQWQNIYDYRVPVASPFGAQVQFDCYYDNSTNNPRNPNNPPKPVSWGEQTTDEMAVAFLGFTVDLEHLIAPSATAAGVVNAASYATGTVAPGAILSLFGVGFGSNWESAATTPLPLALANKTVVSFGQTAAPLFYASPTQINFQVPYESSASVNVVVVRGDDGKSVTIPLQIGEAQPGIFTADSSGTGPAAAQHADGSVLNASNPAARGEVVVIYTTGLGRVTPAAQTGVPATGAASTVNKVTVNIGGVDVDPSYAGLVPGFVGLYQVNVAIPAGLTPGDLPVKLKVASVESNTAIVSVK